MPNRIASFFIIILLIASQTWGSTFLIESVDEKKLDADSLKVHKAALALVKDRTSVKKQQNYIESFPSKFNLFLDIFHPKDFGQLYDGASYIDLFNQTALKHPKIAANKYLSLAAEACFDADAPNYFRHVLRQFKKKYKSEYDNAYQMLSYKQKQNVQIFLKASFHPHDSSEGFCESTRK